MEFKELVKRYSTEDLQTGAKDLLARLNDSVRSGGLFDGLAACYGMPLADILAEIAVRKRYHKKADNERKEGAE